jgi:hypothetical protein
MHRRPRLIVTALLLGAAMAPTWAFGSPHLPAAAPRAVLAFHSAWEQLAQLWGWLGSLRPDQGRTGDPAGAQRVRHAPSLTGGPQPAVRPDEGSGVDPYG